MDVAACNGPRVSLRERCIPTTSLRFLTGWVVRKLHAVSRNIFIPTLLAFAAVACGGSDPPPKTADTTPTPSASASASTTTAAATPDAGAAAAPDEDAKYTKAESADHVDPDESDGPIILKSLVPKATPKTAFPKATIPDGQSCLGAVPWSGNHKVDYQTVVDKCGTPNGMLKYVEPRDGRLHAKKDKADLFQVKVYKNMCYRYFAVADDGIKDIDILVLKKGAMMAMDKTSHPVAIIDHDKLWCVDEDMDLDFRVEIDGPGAGTYTFGVWTRPKQ